MSLNKGMNLTEQPVSARVCEGSKPTKQRGATRPRAGVAGLRDRLRGRGMGWPDFQSDELR
jgi:hypothetical protein